MCQKHDNEEAVRRKGQQWSSMMHLEVGIHSRGEGDSNVTDVLTRI